MVLGNVIKIGIHILIDPTDPALAPAPALRFRCSRCSSALHLLSTTRGPLISIARESSIYLTTFFGSLYSRQSNVLRLRLRVQQKIFEYLIVVSIEIPTKIMWSRICASKNTHIPYYQSTTDHLDPAAADRRMKFPQFLVICRVSFTMQLPSSTLSPKCSFRNERTKLMKKE
jgi:hypothetical protein